jgi:ATP-dependent protease ClpP protease subunit
MNKNFNIYSEIVDDGCKWVEEDVSPSDFRAFSEGVESGDEVTLNNNSVGGSVLGGVAIAN